MVLKPEKEKQAEAIFRKWGLDFAIVGYTTPSKRFVVKHGGDVMADLPIKELGDYGVAIRLTRNVTANFAISVVGEDGTTMADIKAKSEAPAATAEAADTAPDGDAEDTETDESDGSDEYAVDEAGEKEDEI